MAFTFGDNVDFTQKQLLNAIAHGVTVDPSSPVAGQLWYRSDLARMSYYDGTAARRVPFRLDQLDAPTADVSMNSHKITSLATPTNANDAANKTYVDAALQGVSWKDSVRLASTANVNVASSAGTIDGVLTSLGDRVLLKDQTAGAENGIYLVSPLGFYVRAVDADSAADIQGATVSVDEGSANAGTLWNMTTDSVTLDTTSLTWIKIGQLSDLIAGAGLVKTGNTVDVVALDGSITVAADTITVGNVPVAKGGTGATTAAGARTNLAAPGRATVNVSGGTSYNFVHNLAAQGVIVSVLNSTTGQELHVGQIRADLNTQVVDLSLLSGAVTYTLTAIGGG
jgi:hypothetical protein